ncbi:MAG: septum formation initiator family protein [Synergistaceae bacterium]|nr:septum formation initiator family protein [Synergistaceae bacterium]
MLSIKRIIIIALGVIGFFLTVGYYRFELDRIASINAAIAKGEAELEKKREIVRIFREKAEFYKTQEGIEHLAREQYNLVGNNERVFLLVSPDEQKIFTDE